MFAEMIIYNPQVANFNFQIQREVPLFWNLGIGTSNLGLESSIFLTKISAVSYRYLVHILQSSFFECFIFAYKSIS